MFPAAMAYDNASWMNVLRAGYILVAVASQSNFLRRKMLAWIRLQMVFTMICSLEYGSLPIRWISWHYSMRDADLEVYAKEFAILCTC
jgi:hypothetical protein